MAGGQVGPQLKAAHAPGGVGFGHFLVQNAVSGRHPLHVAGVDRSGVADAVFMRHRALDHVGDRFDAAVRVPGEAGDEIRRFFAAEVVQQQEGIEQARLVKAKCALQAHAGAFHGWRGANDALDRSVFGHGVPRGRIVNREA